jgi:hypothetical protein
LLAHGLWVWHTGTVPAAPLRDFCVSQGITEVYVSVSGNPDLTAMIALLHGSHIKVEALLSSTNADEPGPHRDKLLTEARAVIASQRFDGIHLDIEPQQRPENKGPGNIQYLPGLVETYRAVWQLAEPAHLTVDADILTKLLKGTVEQRRSLLTSLPRFTLMFYQQHDAGAALDAAYEGLSGPDLATMAIGLRTADYGDSIPQALHALDDAERGNPHYAGWARHSYNDVLRQ